MEEAGQNDTPSSAVPSGNLPPPGRKGGRQQVAHRSVLQGQHRGMRSTGRGGNCASDRSGPLLSGEKPCTGSPFTS